MRRVNLLVLLFPIVLAVCSCNRGGGETIPENRIIIENYTVQGGYSADAERYFTLAGDGFSDGDRIMLSNPYHSYETRCTPLSSGGCRFQVVDDFVEGQYTISVWRGEVNFRYGNAYFSSYKNPCDRMRDLFVDNTDGYVAEVIECELADISADVSMFTMQYKDRKGARESLFLFDVTLTSRTTLAATVAGDDNSKYGTLQRMSQQLAAMDARSDVKVLGGVNGDYFSAGLPLGIFYRNGVALKNSYNQDWWHTMALLNTGTLTSFEYNELSTYSSRISEAICGSVKYVDKGAISGFVAAQSDTSIHPRTSIGVDRSGKRVYIIAVDGRSTGYSDGMTYYNMALLYRALGAYYAINLDGGGSTTFIARIDDKLTVKNRPSDGSERAVTNGWAIVERVQ